VTIDLKVKIAAFCRELGGSILRETAHEQGEGKELAFQRAEASFKAGRDDAELEADLDLLDEMVRQVMGTGLFSSRPRGYGPLPHGSGPETGAQWWTCPHDRCTGRGRVQPGVRPPVCAATGEPLTPGPLP